MKRFLMSISGIIVLILVIATIVIAMSWSHIPNIISSKLSETMKVRVNIDDMQVGWKTINLQKTEIGNPPGSILSKAFSAEQILVEAPLTNYLDNHIVIDNIELQNVYVGLEFDSKSSRRGNWYTIMAPLQAPKHATGAKPGKTVLIKKLVLTNISIDLVYRQGGAPVKHLAPIKRLEFDNLNSEEGLPYEQISNIIFQQMLKQIFSIEGLQNMLQDLVPSPQNGIQKLLQPFKNLLNDATPEEQNDPAA
ncbi:MAG: AsmA family protein [Simkania sp.]|nr:AsmA family protein [Simkania sp.]